MGELMKIYRTDAPSQLYFLETYHPADASGNERLETEELWSLRSTDIGCSMSCSVISEGSG
jgi:hypothetical protein